MPKVVIFDSGVGGLSIFQEVHRLMPENHYVFVSDAAAFPYGIKKESVLIERVLTVCQTVLKKFTPDLVIIACNTASTVTLPHLREKFDVPFVGVVPAIKPAAVISTSKVIGLLATPATIERGYTQSLIDQFADDCRVIRVGTSALVEIAEQKLANERVDIAQVERILQPFLNTPELDTLILACTHFPLLKEEIKSVFEQYNHNIEFVDSGSAIASRVQDLTTNIKSSASNEPNQAWLTALNTKHSTLTDYLTTLGFSKTQLLILN